MSPDERKNITYFCGFTGLILLGFVLADLRSGRTTVNTGGKVTIVFRCEKPSMYWSAMGVQLFLTGVCFAVAIWIATGG